VKGMHRLSILLYVSLFAMHGFEVCKYWVWTRWACSAAVASIEPKAIRAKIGYKFPGWNIHNESPSFIISW
jgi:hypothetical protein